MAAFKSLSLLVLKIKTQQGRALWDTGFHTTIKDTLRHLKHGVPFSTIGIRICRDHSLPIGDVPNFFALCTYSNLAEGDEKFQETVSHLLAEQTLAD
jgi:hypothetical protein